MKCPICLKDYEEDEVVKKLPCSHHFHPACILPWLHKVSAARRLAMFVSPARHSLVALFISLATFEVFSAEHHFFNYKFDGPTFLRSRGGPHLFLQL